MLMLIPTALLAAHLRLDLVDATDLHPDDAAVLAEYEAAALDYLRAQTNRPLEYEEGVTEWPEIPPLVRHALLLLVSHWYEVRADTTDRRRNPADHAVTRIIERLRYADWAVPAEPAEPAGGAA